MMVQCQHCGAQVRATKNGTGGFVTAIAIVLVVVVSGVIVFRSLYNNTSKDTATIGSHIGQIGGGK